MTYPEIRRSDTTTRLDRLTEAEYARLEFQQTVFCLGEHLTVEPIKFGRAFEEPPFFTFAGVVRSNAVGTVRNDDFRFINPGPDNSEIGAMEAYWEIAADGTTGPFVWSNLWFGANGAHPEVYAWTSGYTAATSAEVIDWTYEFKHPTSEISVPVGGQDGDHLIIWVGRDSAWEFTTNAYSGFTRNYSEGESVGDPRSIAGYIRHVTNWTGEPASYTWVDDTHGDPMHVLMILVRGLVDSPYNGTNLNDITVHSGIEEFDSFSRTSSAGDLTIRASFSSEAAPVFTALSPLTPTAFFIGHLTVGVAEWIQDGRGMYVGANLWYKMTSESIPI